MLYCTILYCTICITLDSEGFLHKHATSSQLLHTVTLDMAGSHHRSNYLRRYCLAVSFKINKPLSVIARARTHVLLFQQFFTTRLQAQLRCYCAVLPVQYNVTYTHDTISLRTPFFQTTHAFLLFVHDIQFLMDLYPMKMRTLCSTVRSGTHTPRRSVVSPNKVLWVTAPGQPGNSNMHFVCIAVCCVRTSLCIDLYTIYTQIHQLTIEGGGGATL
jgi:hypothetical protein